MLKRRRELTLFPHQEDGVRQIRDGFDRYIPFVRRPARAFLLCDEMGLGKTIQTLAVLRGHDVGRPTLIVCPASVVDVWSSGDLATYFADTFADVRVVGRQALDDLSPRAVVICSYAMLTSRVAQLAGTRWGHLVLDEAQALKSGRGATCKAVAKLAADYRLGLTGTPIMNSGQDVVNILKHALGFGDCNLNSEYVRATLLRNFTLRRTKADVGLARARVAEVELLEWKDYQQGIERYRAIRAAARLQLDEEQETVDLSSFFAKMQKLRQTCLWAKQCVSPKMRRVAELYRADFAGEKVVVVSAYRKFLEKILAPYLEKECATKVALFAGGSRKEQKRALRDFTTDPAVRFLLLVKQAGATGLNLQDAASCVVIMEPHFNRALDEQAAHRVDRIGQQKTVRVRTLVMKDSIESALLKMQENKQAHAREWLEGDNHILKVFKMHLKAADRV